MTTPPTDGDSIRDALAALACAPPDAVVQIIDKADGMMVFHGTAVEAAEFLKAHSRMVTGIAVEWSEAASATATTATGPSEIEGQ